MILGLPTTDLEALALTMIGEARGEGDVGMVAVGNTITNRVAHPSWRGKTILEVCLKPYQYSCWNLDNKNRKFLLELDRTGDIYWRAFHQGQHLINGDYEDITNGATYYYAPNSIAKPKWAMGKKPCATIGNHVFYKDIA